MGTEGRFDAGGMSALRRARLIATDRYYRSLAPHRQASRRRSPALALDRWAEGLKGAQRIVVVAGGPTALRIPRDPTSLHVSTNLSERLVADLPYVNFFAEGNWVARYVKNGPATRNCRGTFLRLQVLGDAPGPKALAHWAVAQSRRYERWCPEVTASNVYPDGAEHDNYEALDDVMRTHLGTPVLQYNSGFGATYLGFYLAAALDVPLDVYGVDAGLDGLQHFDGSQHASPSVTGDRVRTKLTEFLRRLEAQDAVEFTNHSAFMPSSRLADPR